MNNAKLQRSVCILLFLYFLFTILHLAKPFLVPIAFAGLLAMLFLPMAKKLENKGWNRALAVLATVLVLVLVVMGILSLLAWQISDMTQNSAQLERNVMRQVNLARRYIATTLGISQQEQQKMIQKQQSFSGRMAGNFTTILTSFASMFGKSLLVLIYFFLFQYFRTQLRNFVLKLVPQGEKPHTLKTIEECRRVAQKYLGGLGLMIVTLWVMYTIGFTIAGVKNPFFFAILCGLLEIVPFVGNITGTAITVLASVAQGGNMSLIIGILITYGIVQFIQTYLLEPLIVGNEVNINPLFTIAGLVAGELIWGIPGMVLAIPVMGIAKIICDNVESLKPYGYLLGTDKKTESSGLINKIKSWFK
ncbi:MAG TPA: AI-2E family transporter [Chitinophagaceae bacterium]|jgi:predicted PurR-regulated permease PerM|nr:AI-2E family transporter [Chitinophagaceae bacterium]